MDMFVYLNDKNAWYGCGIIIQFGIVLLWYGLLYDRIMVVVYYDFSMIVVWLYVTTKIILQTHILLVNIFAVTLKSSLKTYPC